MRGLEKWRMSFIILISSWKRNLTKLTRELQECLAQQTATGEILRVIASAPTELQPVLDTVAENAARVCGANDAVIFLIKDDVLWRAAVYGSLIMSRIGEAGPPIDRGTVPGRAVIERQTRFMFMTSRQLRTSTLEPHQRHSTRRCGPSYRLRCCARVNLSV